MSGYENPKLKTKRKRGKMVMRKNTVEKVAKAIMNAINDEKIESQEDVASVIRKATISEKQLKALSSRIEAKKKELKELEEIANG